MPAPKDPVKYALWKERIIAALTGRKQTLDTRKKKSKAYKKWLARGGIPNNTGKHHSASTLKKMRAHSFWKGKCGKDNPLWKGGRKITLLKLNSRRRTLGHEMLNEPFAGSEAHHIDKTHVLHIPKKLHRSVWHTLNRPETMEEINAKAFACAIPNP